jgi:hypothetical protein
MSDAIVDRAMLRREAREESRPSGVASAMGGKEKRVFFEGYEKDRRRSWKQTGGVERLEGLLYCE